VKNILVVPCATQVGVEQYHSLKYNKHFKLIGASHNDTDLLYKRFIKLTASKEDPKFIQELKQIIKQYGIDAILPAHDDIQYILKNEPELEAVVIGACKETVNICRFKSKTYEQLSSNYLLAPKVPQWQKFVGFENFNTKLPFLKPDRGQGTRGSFLWSKAKEHLLLEGEYLQCEYLPGYEYTVECFTGINGELSYANPRQRTAITNGISEVAYITNDSLFYEIAKLINATLKFNGAWFYQMKRDSDLKLKFLEVGARIPGASITSRLNGVNLTALTLYQHFGYKVDIMPQKLVSYVKRQFPKYKLDYDTIFLDYDDTYVYVIDYLKTLDKQIIIITRNTGILDLPYEIIRVGEKELKSDFINTQMQVNTMKPIFIDDSHKERADVLQNCNIPCFAPEEVEYLNM